MVQRVAIVTGGNKGIGFHIVEGLCKDFDGDVYLTARSKERGEAAVRELKAEGYSPYFHQLDVSDEESAKEFAVFIKEKYGGFDVLINNAGIVAKATDSYTKREELDLVFGVNYFGCVNVCKHLIPIIREGARLVHVSSGAAGIAYQNCTQFMQEKVLTIHSLPEVDDLMMTYTSTAKLDMEEKLGWPNSEDTKGLPTKPWIYGVSKIGMTLHAERLQEELNSKMKDVIVSSCSPGYCDTDMTDHKGTRSPSEGASVVLSLALLPAMSDHPKGKYKGGDGQIVDWYNVDVRSLFKQMSKK